MRSTLKTAETGNIHTINTWRILDLKEGARHGYQKKTLSIAHQPELSSKIRITRILRETTPRACPLVLSDKHQYLVYSDRRPNSGVHVGSGYRNLVYYLV